jgi:aspartyl-tRNA(Asn)/glutamyl-tRNA(Gln) amidotransferase subunit C
MKVDSALIQHLAHLSRLHVSPEAEPAMIEDLTRVLGFVDKLNEVNTDGLEPLIYMVDDVNVMREDTVQQDITRKDALKNAPRHDSDYFRVPRFVENEA